MAIEAARLVAIIEVQNADAAARQLQNFDTQIGRVGQSATKTGSGFAALDRNTLNAGQRAQVAGQNFANMGKGVDTAASGAQRAGGSFGGLGTALSGISPKALLATAGVAGLGVTAINTAGAAVSAGIDFESAFAGVVKTVSGTTAEMAVLESGIRNMATSMPVAATEIAGIAEAAGALGVAKDDILELTETAALIGVTTDVSSDQAATSLGQLSNVLGLTADDYEAFGSTLVELGNSGASTESSILGITSRIGAATELIGFATDETLAWSSAVANLGMETQAAGGSLQTFFVSAAQMVSEAGAELEILAETAGMTASVFQSAYAEDSSAALQSFITGLGDLNQAQQLATLSALGFNDINISRTLLGLAANTDNLTSSLTTSEGAWRSNTAMQIEAATRFETTASKLTVARNRLNEVALAAYDAYQPAMVGAIDVTSDFIESLGKIPDVVKVVVELSTSGDYGTPQTSAESPVLIESDVEKTKSAYTRLNAWLADNGPHTYLYDFIGDMGVALNLIADQDIKKLLSIPVDEATVAQLREIHELATAKDYTFGDIQASNAAEAYLKLRTEWQLAAQDAAEFAQSNPLIEENLTAGAEAARALQDANFELADSWFRTAEAQGTSAAATGRLTDARVQELAIMSDLESGLGAYMGQLSEAERAADAAGIATLKFQSYLDEIGITSTTAAEGLGNFGVMQDIFQANISAAGEGVSEWQGHLSGAETALGFLQEKMDAGVALSEREREQYDTLTGAVERYQGGIEDQSVALIDAEVNKAKFIETQDTLNQALADGSINQDEYNEAIANAAASLDPATAAAMGLTDAQTILAETVGAVVGELRDLMVELGLIPPDVTTEYNTPGLPDAMGNVAGYGDQLAEFTPSVETEFTAHTSDANATVDTYDGNLNDVPGVVDTYMDAHTADANMNLNEYTGKLNSIQPSVSTSISANIGSAVGALNELIAMATATRVMNVVVQASGFSPFADGGISQGGLALVGEQGPEFVILPKGAEVIANPETMAIMADVPWLGGFAAGTGSIINDSKSVNHGIINASAGTGFVETGMDIGEQIWQGIGIAMSAGAFDDYTVSGEQIADAMLKGAVTKIESDSSDVADTWVVNMDRVPELASQIGQDTAMALLEEYAKLQGELQLAILSGDDTGEINAQLAAIEALFVEWGISVIGTATSVADVMADIARADHFGNMFSLPSTPANYSLDDIISGDAQQTIRQDFHDIWDLQKIATELGYDEFAAELGQQMAALGLDEEFVNAVIKSDTGQKMAAEAAAAMESAALGDIMNDYTIEEIFSGDAIAQIGEVKASLQEKHDIALALGDEALAAEYAAMIAEMEAQEVRVNVIMDTGVGDGAVAAAEWEVRIDNATTGPNFGAGIQDDIDALDLKIDLGNLAGAPSEVIAGWEAEKEALVEQSEQYWYDIARGAANGLYDDETLAAYAEAGGAQFEAYLGEFLSPEGAAAMIEGINDITDASIGQIQAAFDAAPEMAAGFIDDLVMGVNDGRFDVEQAYGLLASIPRDEMLPVLDELEEKWTVDLVQAIVDGNIELEASLLELLETLGLIKAEAEATAAVDPFPWLHDGGPAGLPSSNGSSVPGNLSSTLSGSRTGWNYSGGNRETQQAHYDKQLKYYQDRSPGYQAWASMQEPTRAAVIPLANGAVINEPLLALMGESGTEMVQPLSAGHPERQRFIEDVTASVVKVLGVSGNQQAPIFMLGTRPFVAETNKAIMSGHISRRGPR